jgi:hypothetical protein
LFCLNLYWYCLVCFCVSIGVISLSFEESIKFRRKKEVERPINIPQSVRAMVIIMQKVLDFEDIKKGVWSRWGIECEFGAFQFSVVMDLNGILVNTCHRDILKEKRTPFGGKHLWLAQNNGYA